MTFYTGKKKNGWVYYGDFPINLLQKSSDYSIVSLKNENLQNWKVSVDSLLLQHHSDSAKTDVSLHEINTYYKLSLNHKALGLPQSALKSLEKKL